MEVTQALRARRSVRAFLPDVVAACKVAKNRSICSFFMT